MKRTLCLVLVLTCLLLSLCGCQSEEPEWIAPVNFYYCNDPITFYGKNDVIIPEIRESDGYDDLTDLIELYLDGPISEGFSTPFPVGTTIHTISQGDGKIFITLSSQFASLTGIALTLSCACICMTLMELSSAETIIISADGGTLDGSESITMTKASLALLDLHAPQNETTSQPEE